MVIFRDVNVIEISGCGKGPLQNLPRPNIAGDLYSKANKIFRLLDYLFACFLKGPRVPSKQDAGNPVRVKLYHPS